MYVELLFPQASFKYYLEKICIIAFGNMYFIYSYHFLISLCNAVFVVACFKDFARWMGQLLFFRLYD